MDKIIFKNVSPLNSSVADPDPACHFDADPDPTCHFDTDPDPSFQIKAQNLENRLKLAHIQYILACHLQIDPYPAYNFDADPMRIRIRIQHITLRRIRIRPFNLMRIHADADPQHCYPTITIHFYFFSVSLIELQKRVETAN